MRSYQLKFYFSVCLLLICFASLRAQQDSIKEHENLYKKNTIHGSLGTLFPGITANIFYDRILSESENGYKFSTLVRFGYQKNFLLFWQDNVFILEGRMLTGRNFAHFESALGVTYLDVIRPAFFSRIQGPKTKWRFYVQNRFWFS